MQTSVRDGADGVQTWWESTDEAWREILLINLIEEKRHTEVTGTRTAWVTPAERYRALGGAASELSVIQGAEDVMHLRKVDCYGTAVSDLSPLARLETLREAYCGATPVTDLKPIQNCAGLENLCLYSTPVSNLEPLGSLQKLRRLCCANTKVQSLAPLSGLQQLEVLSISNTAIASLRPIWGLPLLWRLRCANTAIPAVELDRFRRDHPRCEVLIEESEEDDFALTLHERGL